MGAVRLDDDRQHLLPATAEPLQRNRRGLRRVDESYQRPEGPVVAVCRQHQLSRMSDVVDPQLRASSHYSPRLCAGPPGVKATGRAVGGGAQICDGSSPPR